MSLVEVYDLLRCVVQPQWHSIPPTSSEEWKTFAAAAAVSSPSRDTRAAAASSSTAGVSSFPAATPATRCISPGAAAFPAAVCEAIAGSLPPPLPSAAAAAAKSPATAPAPLPSTPSPTSSSSSFSSSFVAAETPASAVSPPRAAVEAGLNALPRKQRLLLLVQAAAMLETPWAVAQVRLRGVEEAAKSRPLHLEELISYARRLGGTTAAPPETANIADPAAHETVYPSFHFLPFPSLEELQTSRLSFLQSKDYGKICFPPDIRPRLLYQVQPSASSLRSSSGSTQETDGRGSEGGRGSSRASYSGGSSEVRHVSPQVRRVAAGYEIKFFCQTSGATFKYRVVNGVVPAAAAAAAWAETEPAEERVYDPQQPPVIPPPFPKTVLARATHPSLLASAVRALCLKLRVAPTSSSRLRVAAAAEAARETGTAARRERSYPGGPLLPSAQTAAAHEGREAVLSSEAWQRVQQQQQGMAMAAAGAEAVVTQQQHLHSETTRSIDSEPAAILLGREAGARRGSMQQQQQTGGTTPAAAAAFRGLLLGTARRKRRTAERVQQQQQERQEASDDSEDSSSSGEESSEEEEGGAEGRAEKS